MPEISVIVPVYKVEKYLDRCVQSILNQTFTDFELILVDDGSPDKCPQMCDEWEKKDSRIRVIHKENGGLSSARNAGLDSFAGKYVSFVDSDDWLEEDALQYLLFLIKKENADMVMGSFIRNKKEDTVFQNKWQERILTQKEFLTLFFKLGTQDNVQYAWGKLYKAKLFSEIRYPDGLIAEDIPAIFQISLKCRKIIYSSKIVYHYYINPDSITGQLFSVKNFDLLEDWDLVLSKAEETGDNWLAQGAKINRARADLGVLMELLLSDISYEEKILYKSQIRKLVKSLQKNVALLFGAPIPISRKIAIVFCAAFYVQILYLYSLIRRVF